MYRDSFTGTPEQIREHIASLKLPGELTEHDAIKKFALANVPTYGASKWRYTMCAESAYNLGGTSMSGFLAVTANEV